MVPPKEPVPRQRVSNSEIEYELQITKLELSNALREAEASLTIIINEVKADLSEHLLYHSSLIKAAKELADKRNKRLTLLVSVSMLIATTVSIIIGVSH